MPRSDTDEWGIGIPNNADIPPALPDGDYEVCFTGWDDPELWAREKRLFLFFVVNTPGPYFGDKLYMTCTIAKKGKWRPSFKYWRTWVLANGKQPSRSDRLSTSVFRNKVFLARVRKVTRTSKKDIPRTPEQQYSVVDELLRVLNR